MNKHKKLGICIMAYLATDSIISTIERIPERIKKSCKEIYIFDDASPDNFTTLMRNYKKRVGLHKLNFYKNNKNLGFGGNTKKCFDYAIKKKYDLLVVLHGDGQYPPEKIPLMIRPILEGYADMVIGSRLQCNPIREGMPIWKYLGNKFLTFLENKTLNLHLSEAQSGFKAYSVKAFKKINFNSFSNDYHFTTQLLFEFSDNNLKIAEIPIPVFYAPNSNILKELKKSLIFGFKILKLSWNHKFNKKVTY
jgi:glycosyltransferase involved in cell wall biosynthesis